MPSVATPCTCTVKWCCTVVTEPPRSALTVAGFKVRETTGGYGKPAGRVYSQYPIPLKLAAKGAVITLIVSDGTN